ncbi:MAG TPA: gluconate 2-dehydrogenase subunit 3 family protein [Longimicrobiales bacterium]|nr:gluconate 2-dehydrogenase subunit 3 family protein [Longimicrobiales bacterium]
MERRTLLRILGATAAFAGWSPAELEALLTPGGRLRQEVALFGPEERAALTAFADTVLPATDTPGAVEVGSVDFVELIVSRTWDPDGQRRFRDGLAELDRRARDAGAPSFDAASALVRTAILEEMQASGRRRMRDGGGRSFFHEARNLVMEGYYTSEAGMKEELGFVPIPGRYDGSVPVEQRTRGGAP